MRRRILLSTLGVAVTAILLLGIPLAWVVSKLIYDDAKQSLNITAAGLIKEVEVPLGRGERPDPGQIARAYPHLYIEIRLPDGSTETAGRAIPGETMSATSTTDDITVTVHRAYAEVRDEVLRQLLLIASLILLGVAIATVLAILLARRLTLPLVDLVETAERLGTGNARPRRRRYGIPEVDTVAEVLDTSAVRIADLLASSREFASDASHQLRTPLTALTMRLEEMVEAADYPDVVREEGQAALAQAERLVAVVEQLLARAKHDRTGQAVPTAIDLVIEQQIEEWRPIFAREGRAIHLEGDADLVSVVTPSCLSQILATLLDNSLMHGSGTVTLATRLTRQNVVVEVGDEGPGVAPELAKKIFERSVSGAGGTGLGLYLARSLAAVDGGRLELVQARPAVFAFFMRRREEARLAHERVVSGPV
ncbi:signal transduction histidine kinase [Actinocorallia herbida]|uniref:Signal transduction histidine-protein kinase/phosphatase MprB n=1 Tax=Actinocorallia herbida TaxID=58109 RepID=A0A3N1D974_9ACTN|nr:ATP-binding protein [Actinocorallia herbida]ROO90080.1 signal transduction histidine kinase [Actinocorallia herbida]